MPKSRGRPAPDARLVDHRPHLILPGFIDAHAHFPQMQIIASYGAELLDWLNKYTFPEETKFFNPQHGRRIARLFLDEMVRHGTTTVAAYCSVHKESAEAFFAEAAERNMLVIAGKVMMDRNAPAGLTDTPQSGYDDSKALISAWHGKGRQLYAVTPRFAITSSPEQMEMAGALVREHPGLPHADASVGKPRRDRLDAGALSLVAATIPMSTSTTGCSAARACSATASISPTARPTRCRRQIRSRCSARPPTFSSAPACSTTSATASARSRSGSPRRPMSAAAPATPCCRTMDEGYKVIALNGEKLNPLASFWQLTAGNAEALSIGDRVGRLEPGKDADITVLDSGATPAMRLRMETVETLAEELFLLQTLGDDRAVVETYVAGRPAKSVLPA